MGLILLMAPTTNSVSIICVTIWLLACQKKVQRGAFYAIVDEVDSILIDEARTPLIISGPAGESTELYTQINALVPKLTRQKETDGPGDYSVDDEKSKQIYITEEGHQHVEEFFNPSWFDSSG